MAYFKEKTFESKRIKSLLWLFIYEKYDDYLEPQRKGTPKGEPIGLSKNKYSASLWMLAKYKFREIADKHNVSLKLVTKWSAEPLFKSAVANHCEEFCHRFIDHTKSLYVDFIKDKTSNDREKFFVEWREAFDSLAEVSVKRVLPVLSEILQKKIRSAKNELETEALKEIKHIVEKKESRQLAAETSILFDEIGKATAMLSSGKRMSGKDKKLIVDTLEKVSEVLEKTIKHI